ncbi:TonB family protein [Roseivivax marinus]|uniref:TonB family protein n=1 Tax=Roseivivax marinus TaxID=1379903 RepID=UPI001F04CF94|nr:TonB family protein [Roseivivax marinus]UMA66585.1 TonB family protein [Roseivivax marinus]
MSVAATDIPFGGIGKALALAGAVLVHAAAGWALLDRAPDIKIEAGRGGAAARLGTFADLAAGTLSAENPREITRAESAGQNAPAATAPRPEPTEPIRAARAAEVIEAGRSEATPTRSETAATQAPVRADGMLSAGSAAVPEVSRSDKAEPAARPDPAAALTPEAPTSALAADSPDTAAVARSLRPARRSAAFEARHRPAPEPEPAPRRQAEPQRQARPEPAAPPAAGTAERNARRGATTETPNSNATQQGTRSGQGQQAGNAAASNYRGAVMRRISRLGPLRTNRSGTAQVRFTVSGSGALAGIEIAASSGSGALDGAALAHIRQAAPFPPPPAGAPRTFTIRLAARR